QQAVVQGLITEAEVDAVVRRVLALKFRMGLFEDPGLSQADRIRTKIGCPAHREVALRAARESLVLLRNETVVGAPLLPLDPKVPRKLAVVGPNADDPLAQLGDWSLGSGQMVGPSGTEHPRSSVVTVRDGVKHLLPPGWTLTHPADADVIVAVVGDNLHYTGEGKSTATLELMDGQIELLDRLTALGKPLVGVLINSKPLVLPVSLLTAGALLECFNPGMLGGQAVAEALFGLINPSGKLTISFPRHAGQQPVFYNAARGQHGTRYADLSQDPAFAFGYGLGYSPISVGTPVLDRETVDRSGEVRVEAVVANHGDRDGIEVVQLYVEDEVTSATWARRELKAWSRVEVAAGATRRVSLAIRASDLWIIDGEGRKVVEPGRFRILVGNSSRDVDLKEAWLTLV
ncbi:MAG TPA: glycoside hydrolase family 3 C-terminal domain-containing protein, partial [Spirochaetia bacterium]|nr:glycoside hydrolase family 3 C-terminal domain-containing protein [Spirochaetia bacterium]